MQQATAPQTTPAAGGGLGFPESMDGQRAMDDGFIGAVVSGSQVAYVDSGTNLIGQYSRDDGGAWVVHDAEGQEIQRQPMVAEMLPLMLRGLNQPELRQADTSLLDSVGSLGLLALVAQLQEASASATAPGIGALDRLALIAKVQEISDQILAATGTAAPAVHKDAAGHEYTVMTEPVVLYRAMSPEEWDHIVATGSITGGGSKFNSDEARGDVFFADKLDDNLLRQGKDRSRRIGYQLAQSGTDATLRQAREEEAKLEAEVQEKVGDAHRAAMQRLQNVRKIVERLAEAVQQAYTDKSKELATTDAMRGYSMVVIQTKPITGGKVYQGKHSNYAGTEYGFEPGKLHVSDIENVTYVNDGQAVKTEDAGAAAAVSSEYQSRPEAGLSAVQVDAMRKLQTLPSAGLSLDDYSAQLFEVWFPVGEEALDNNQEATPIPEHLAKALDVALAGFLELEKTTYENL